MSILELAVPFFILSMIVELVYGVAKGRNTYRLNDSVSSLFLGVLSQARRFVTLGVGGLVYYFITEYFSLPLMDPTHWFTWVLATVLYDFCYYWLHRMGHERTILWAAHVAHHQSEDYNLSTALRQTSTGFLLGWVFYLPMFLVGVPAEVVVTTGALSLLYQYWVHTQHVPKLGWYEWIFVTPSNHRVHHAQNDHYMDRNYGGLYILWDRMFGTFQEELEEEPVVFGIRGAIKSFNPAKALTHIYADMAEDSWRTARWQDKLKVWVSRTGWRPADVAAMYPRDKTDLSHFERFDPVVPAIVSWYGFFQLLAVMALLTAMQLSDPAYLSGVSLWVLLLFTTVTTALWLDANSKAAVMKWEVLRLAYTACLVAVGFLAAAPSGALLAGVSYLIANSLFLTVLVRAVSAPRVATVA